MLINMGNVCNVNYDASQDAFSDLEIELKQLWKYHSQQNISLRDVADSFKSDYKYGNNEVTLVNYSDQQGTSKKFIEDFNKILEDINNSEQFQNESTLLNFGRTLLGCFYQDVPNTIIKVHTSQPQAMGTDSEIHLISVNRLENILPSIYGPYKGLQDNAQKIFYEDLFSMLIYDPSTVKIKNLNTEQVNDLIFKYQEQKFQNILKFLKTQFPNDIELDGSMFDEKDNSLNYKLYNHVQIKFLEYLNTLNKDGLNDELKDLQNGEFRKRSQEAYLQLLDIIQKDEVLNENYLGKFTSKKSRENSKQLYSLQFFSSYYKQVKEIIDDLKTSAKTSVSEDTWNKIDNLIDIIENSNSTLSAVNDFAILYQFDNFLSALLGDQITINKSFKRGVVPAYNTYKKYQVKKSQKHQRAGFETANNENGEAHTGTNVKFILQTIPIQDYKTGEITTAHLNYSLVMNAWAKLLKNIDALSFDSGLHGNIIEQLKNAINTIPQNTLGNVITILDTLFRNNSVKNFSGRTIDKQTNIKALSSQEWNVLYSIWNSVLNLENPNSILKIESNDQNSLRFTSDIIGVLIRNAENDFIDSNHLSDKGTFGVFKKLNVDYAVMDMAGRINYHSIQSQDSPIDASSYIRESYGNQKYGSYLVVRIGDTDYKFGFRYTLGNENEYGLFSESGVTYDDIEVEWSRNDGTTKKLLGDLIGNIDLNAFIKDSINNDLNTQEKILVKLLDIISSFTNLKLNSLDGYELLNTYKQQHTGENYLKGLIKLAVKAAEANRVGMAAKQAGQTLYEYLQSPSSEYYQAFNAELGGKLNLFIATPSSAYFRITTSDNSTLEELAYADALLNGKEIKSTILNHNHDAVPNFNISSLGRELNTRLQSQKDSNGRSLLFVLHPEYIETTPVIDSEVVTYAGQVKNIKDMNSVELFQRAIFDKFYGSFLANGKICFQPTVYSDKVTFLNYLASLDMFDNPKTIMSVMINTQNGYIDNDVSEECIHKYAYSFFAAHNNIKESVFEKYEALINWANISVIGNTRQEKIRNFLQGVNSKELNELVKEYNKANLENQIELESEKDYRKHKDSNGNEYCDLNEVLLYYSELFNNYNIGDRSLIKQYIKQQEDIFLKQIKKYNFSLKVFRNDAELKLWLQGKLKTTKYNPYLRVLSDSKILDFKARETFVNNWINKNTGELILEKEGKINPLFQKFFYIEGLFSNNLRLSLTGSEINHPIKSLTTQYDQIKEIINDSDKLNAFLQTYSDIKLNASQLQEKINNCKNINDLVNYPELRSIYDASILSIINNTEGTQFKRNNIIPATLQHLQTGLIDGTSRTVKVAVINDMQAPVNNFNTSKNIDSQDGSAWMSSIQTILENNSLGEQSVGIARKPIWDAQTSDLTSFQAKFAAFSITNELMRISMLGDSSLWRMFKKMHNLQWGKNSKGNSIVDLTRCIYREGAFENHQQINEFFFDKYILGGQKLYYQNKYGEVVQILGLYKDGNGNYYTEELNTSTNKNDKVYHYFNENSEAISTTDAQNNPKAHTINSLYELFISIGGVNCVNEKGIPSEFSLQVLTNYVIYTGNKLPKKNSELNSNVPITSNDVYQPLKDQFVSYVFNSTAVKNGAKNVNSSNVWMDDTELNTFKLTTDGLGIQLNADHDVIDSEITEFSQVIATCAAYGKDYNTVSNVYYALGKSAIENSMLELKYIENLQKETDPKEYENFKYRLYQIVGKNILEGKSRNANDLSENLKQELQEVFKTLKDTKGNELKVPFSDVSIYRQFITGITSVINAKSIKRKHPGMANVMSPSYNVVQYFTYNVNGQYRKYLYDDIVKRAKDQFRELLVIKLSEDASGNINDDLLGQYNKKNLSEIIIEAKKKNIDLDYLKVDAEDPTLYNKLLAEIYLNRKQATEKNRSKSWFIPTDAVLSYWFDDANQKHTAIHRLDDMNDYYKFKDGIMDIEDKYGVYINRKSGNKYEISLSKDDSRKFKLEYDTKEWHIHFSTGVWNNTTQRYDPPTGNLILDEAEKERLFNATLQLLPDNAILSLQDTTQEQLKTNLGGLTEGSIHGYQSIGNKESNKRSTGVNLTIEAESPYTVTYFDRNNKKQTVVLHKYRKVSNVNNGIKHQISVTTPNNLKPQLVRWQYEDTQRISHYMNIFDLPTIRTSWHSGRQLSRAEVQKVLDDLHDGKFTLDGENYLNIKEGTLEDSEAETVVSNMYRDTFGIDEDVSLADVLDGQTKYFKYDAEVPGIPKGAYDLAFTKKNKNHVLIQFGNSNSVTLIEDPFTSEYVNEFNEIYTEPGGTKIGRYIKEPSWKVVSKEDPNSDSKKKGEEQIVDNQDNVVDKTICKIINGEAYRKIQFVTRKLYPVMEEIKDKTFQSNQYTIYQIANINEIIKGLDFKPGTTEDEKRKAAISQISKILGDLYHSDNFTGVQVYRGKVQDENSKKRISGALIGMAQVKKDANGWYINKKDGKQINDFQKYLINLGESIISDSNWEEVHKRQQQIWYGTHDNAGEKFAAFQSSLHLISSRIPADAMHSFMAMTTIGWIMGTNNIAYVAPIQTWLQGSDYDVDKAYMMGQSFKDDSTYIGWSSLFDSSNYVLLTASKTLPVPRKYTLAKSENAKYSIDQEISRIISIQQQMPSVKGPKYNATKASLIRAYSALINKIDRQQGNYYVSTETDNIKAIIEKVQKHEDYLPPRKYRDAAYKNAASANIINIVNNIRNRDVAYQPITVGQLQRLGKKSPKSIETQSLNMINSFAKYIMQQQNLTGKNVIGIGANGSKDWYNITYYYHDALNTGKDLTNLKFYHNYTRIKGRAEGKIEEFVVRHIPDLANASPEIREKLRQEFYSTEGAEFDTNDKYVDSLLSEVLNAATDNAKELILAKINCGSQFAKYYIHLIMMGADIKDIVSFMTSPAVELIAKYSESDIYTNKTRYVNSAIKLLNGEIPLNELFKEESSKAGYYDPEAIAAEEEAQQDYQQYLADLAAEGLDEPIVNSKYAYLATKLGDIFNNWSKLTKSKSIQKFFEDYILAKTGRHESEIITNYFQDITLDDTKYDMNTNYGISKINELINDINDAIAAKEGYQPTDFNEDLEQFKTLTKEAEETSTLASTWLHLNQGIPQTDEDLIKQIRNMQKSVTTRERLFNIYASKDITNNDKGHTNDEYLKALNSIIEDINKNNGHLPVEQDTDNPARKALLNTITKIHQNNLDLNLNYIFNTISEAIQNGMYGNFNIYEYLKNTDDYRNKAARYYNLIKGTWNILDIVNSIPHYKTDLDLLNYSIQQRSLLSVKGRLLTRAIGASEFQYGTLTDQDYKKIVQYVDKLMVLSYFDTLTEPIDLTKMNKEVSGYNSQYQPIKHVQYINLNSINGIDNLKHFVEHEFYQWLKEKFPHNPLVQDLEIDYYKEGIVLKTALNLFDVDASIRNQQTYNNYLQGIKELQDDNTKFGDYTIADILVLYNLAMNGTKMGGSYLTALFKELPKNHASKIYKYYESLGEYDFGTNEFDHLYNKEDLLIFASPTVRSTYAIDNYTTPFVKVKNEVNGYTLYKRKYDKSNGTYKYEKLENLLNRVLNVYGETANDSIYNFTTALFGFPNLYSHQLINNIFNSNKEIDILNVLETQINLGKAIIFKQC